MHNRLQLKRRNLQVLNTQAQAGLTDMRSLILAAVVLVLSVQGTVHVRLIGESKF